MKKLKGMRLNFIPTRLWMKMHVMVKCMKYLSLILPHQYVKRQDADTLKTTQGYVNRMYHLNLGHLQVSRRLESNLILEIDGRHLIQMTLRHSPVIILDQLRTSLPGQRPRLSYATPFSL